MLKLRTFWMIPLLFLLGCSDDERPSQTPTSGLVINVPDGVPFATGLSSRAETQWAFVRQSATWGDANSSVIDQLLVSLQSSGALTLSGSYTDVNSVINNQSMTIRLTVNANETVSTASAFLGSKTFNHKFEIWRNADVAKALEFYFDEATSLGTDGVLLYYRPNVLSPAEFKGDDVVVESYAFDSADGPKQTYSWSGGAITAGGPGLAGRVIIEEMDDGTLFCFKAVIKMNSSVNLCPGSNNEFYALGYTQRLLGLGEVTAKFSYTDNTLDNTGLACGVANPLNYGLFNLGGFVTDGVDSSFFLSPQILYPASTRVDTLFSEINTAGAGAWDDTQQATIDGLNIQFVNTAAP